MPRADPLHALAAEPPRAALLLDVEGTLAPAARRRGAAVVPEETRQELRRLAGRYGLVACLSEQTGPEAALAVGVPGVLLVAGEELWTDRLAALARSVDWPAEQDGLALRFHWRRADDEDAARAYLGRIARWATEQGLESHPGPQALEVRPPAGAAKGAAVRRLLGEHGLGRALYAGDDEGDDLEAFAALDGIELAVRVAVGRERQQPRLQAAADVVVEGPHALLGLLRRL